MHDKHHEHHQHYALAVFATFAVTAIIVGVLVFQFQEKQFAERLSKTDAELQKAGEIVQELQTEKDGLSEKVEKVSEALSEISTDKSFTDIDFPVAVFTPSGLFTDAERQELTKKIIEPYRTYHKYAPSELGNKPVSMQIKKIQSDSQHESPYSASVVWSSPGYEGWLFGKKGQPLEYWKPSCMEECEYPDEFKEKYPDLVQ